jgi:hypothetical protein
MGKKRAEALLDALKECAVEAENVVEEKGQTKTGRIDPELLSFLLGHR